MGAQKSSNETDSPAYPLGMSDVPRPLHGPMGTFQKHRKNFYVAILVFVGGFLANAMAGDLYDRLKPWKESEDEFIQKIVDKQRAEFEGLRTSLADIRSNLPAGDRDMFKAIEQSVANVERNTAGLVRQLEVAKQDLEALRTVAVSRGGVGSGYDFTLAEDASMDLAPGAIIGLTSVGASGVRVTLTSAGATTERDELIKAGEALPYAGTGGRSCSIALRTFQRGRPGAASFNSTCS